MIKNEHQRKLAESQIASLNSALKALEEALEIHNQTSQRLIRKMIELSIEDLENEIQEYIKSGRW